MSWSDIWPLLWEATKESAYMVSVATVLTADYEPVAFNSVATRYREHVRVAFAIGTGRSADGDLARRTSRSDESD